MPENTIPIGPEEAAEGLRLERKLAHAHDLMHVAENDLNRYVAHLATLHNVPPGWILNGWTRGFDPAAGGVTNG